MKASTIAIRAAKRQEEILPDEMFVPDLLKEISGVTSRTLAYRKVLATQNAFVLPNEWATYCSAKHRIMGLLLVAELLKESGQ